MDCLHKEIASRAGEWRDYRVATIYIGGGTPSLLGGEEICSLMECVRGCMNVSPDAEITIEANPDDVTSIKTRQWMDAGINRVSIGVQSFYDETLKKIGRRHTGKRAYEAIDIIRTSGIENVSVDIIYGIPERSDEHLIEDIHRAVTSGAKHISAYALTREEGTVYALHSFFRKLAQGLGPALALVVMVALGYVGANGGEQTIEVATRMRYLVAGLYLFSAVLQFVGLSLIYNLDKKTLAKMQEDLNARHAA